MAGIVICTLLFVATCGYQEFKKFRSKRDVETFKTCLSRALSNEAL